LYFNNASKKHPLRIVAMDEGGAMANRRASFPNMGANLTKSILQALREAGDPTRGGRPMPLGG
jgi:hypothetical protein